MQIRELSHPKTSKTLNESMAKQFGYRLNLDNFTLEQLQHARDRVVQKIAAFESSREFDAIYENSEYQKERMFLDVITTAISERSLSPGEEEKKEKYFKGMKKAKGEFKSVMATKANRSCMPQQQKWPRKKV